MRVLLISKLIELLARWVSCKHTLESGGGSDFGGGGGGHELLREVVRGGQNTHAVVCVREIYIYIYI